jgi:Na+/H+-dicarboxylate symporter
MIKNMSLNTKIFIGILLGILFGSFLPSIALEQKIIGDVFINLLKMLVVPLVFASIFVAIVGLGTLERLKQIGLKTIGLYMLTTALATFLALIVMNVVSIGDVITNANHLSYAKADKVSDFSFYNMFIGFIPKNIFASLSTGSMMQVIIFAIFLGVSSFYIEEKYKVILYDFFMAINNAMLKMAQWIISLTPIGVFSLISYIIAQQGISVIFSLWQYVLVVLFVLLVHGLITLPLLLRLITKINPYRYLNSVKEASFMAFYTASSAATLPVSLKIVEEKGDVDKKSASFVLPLGATVSMDGTAAYLTIAILFITNIAGMSMSFADEILLAITVIFLSVGVAALPSASLVMMVVILNQFGLDPKYIAVIVVVDRILDMARTSLNVTSDLIVTKIIDSVNKKA